MLQKIIFKIITGIFKPLFWVMPSYLAFYFLWHISKILGFLLSILPVRKEISNNITKIYNISAAENLGKITSKYLHKISRYLLEIINLNNLNLKSTKHISKFSGLNNLDLALAKNKGIILLSMHAGNWELMVCSLGQMGYKLHAVGKTPPGNLWLKMLDDNRQHSGLKIINVLTTNMYRSALAALKQNEIVIIMADTGATDSDKNVELELLGHKIPVASGWATLALRSGAIVVPIFCSTGNKLAHNFLVGEPIDPKVCQSEVELVQKGLKFFAVNLKQDPTEWFLALSTSEVNKTF